MKWKYIPQIKAVPVSLCTLNYSHWLPGKAAIYELQEMLSRNISTNVCRLCRYLGLSCGNNIQSTKSCAVFVKWPCRQGQYYWFITVKGPKSKYCTVLCYWDTTQLKFTIFKLVLSEPKFLLQKYSWNIPENREVWVPFEATHSKLSPHRQKLAAWNRFFWNVNLTIVTHKEIREKIYLLAFPGVLFIQNFKIFLTLSSHNNKGGFISKNLIQLICYKVLLLILLLLAPVP